MKNVKQKILLASAFLMANVIPALALAQRPVGPDQPQPPAWVSWAPIVFILVVFYFLIMRPQAKARKERQVLLEALKKGDRIITQGGLYATIANIGQGTLDVKINEDVKITIARSAVSDVLKDKPKETAPAKA